MRPRTLIAVVMLASFATSSFEAVAGVVRDGTVHHESAGAAAAHAASSAGDHAHDPAQEGPIGEQGQEHKHGTGADHCTHTHGQALSVSSVMVAFSADLSVPADITGEAPSDHVVPPKLHPPRV